MATKALVEADHNKVMAVSKFLKDKADIWVSMVKTSIDPKRYLRIMTSEITRNPDLLGCTDVSILNCFLLSAELGLMPGSAAKELYMVPFNNKNLRGPKKKEAVPIIGYQGKIALALRHPGVLKIEARNVYKGEEEYIVVEYGTDDKIIHPFKFGIDRKPENLLATYAVAYLANGKTQFVFLERDDVYRYRARSASYRGSQKYGSKDSPWFTDEEAMWLKTAVHRLMPFIPKQYEASAAAQIEGAIESGRNMADNGTITLTKDEYRELVGDDLDDAIAEPKTPTGCVLKKLSGKKRVTPDPGPTDVPRPILAKVREAMEHAPDKVRMQLEQEDLASYSDDALENVLKQINEAIDKEAVND